MKPGAWGALVLLFYLFAGCTSPSIKMNPIHVRASRNDARVASDAYDAAELFDRAALEAKNGHYPEAVGMYRRLVAEFGDSELAPLSLYNSGLCNEHQKNFQAAAADYGELIEDYPESDDFGSAMFRLSSVNEQLEAWANSVTVLDKLLYEYPDLTGIERIEALARKGSNLIQLGYRKQARSALEEASIRFRSGRELPPSPSTYFYAMAQFKIGEIVQAEMQEAALPADEALLEKALEIKCQLLLDAQNEYTKTIRIAHPHWAAAAAYRIGNLYHTLWDHMITAPIPENLSDQEQEIYTEILKGNIQVLLKKATRQWERTLKMARRLNLSNEWISQTSKELEAVRLKMLKNDHELEKR